MIRVLLPTHLRRLAQVSGEVFLSIDDTMPLTQRAMLDALEARYPMLRGTIRDQVTGKRRGFVRFFACQSDVSNESPDTPLPELVLKGEVPFMIVGAMAGGLSFLSREPISKGYSLSEIIFREGQSGSGSGTIAPDGSAVGLYLRLGPREVPAIIDRALPPHSSILDLGCGTGAVAHELQRLGHNVTAVDECAEMLEHVQVPVVLSRIEDLRIPNRFDAVVLASHLLNTVPPSKRRHFLRACRDHVRDDGQVLLELYDPNAFADAPLERTSGGEVFRIYNVIHLSRDVTRATLSWSFSDGTWIQQITVWYVALETLDRELAAVGLRLVGTIDGEPHWVIAVPMTSSLKSDHSSRPAGGRPPNG